MKLSKVFHAVDYINVLRICHSCCLLASVLDMIAKYKYAMSCDSFLNTPQSHMSRSCKKDVYCGGFVSICI